MWYNIICFLIRDAYCDPAVVIDEKDRGDFYECIK